MTKPGLLLFMTDIDPAHESEFHRWYEEEHIPERMAIPGFLTAGVSRHSKAVRNIWRSMISRVPMYCARPTISA